MDLQLGVNTTMSKIAQFTEQRERGKTKRQCANYVKRGTDTRLGKAKKTEKDEWFESKRTKSFERLQSKGIGFSQFPNV